MKSGLTVKQDHATDLLKRIKTLTQTQVMVGVPAEKTEREPEGGESAEVTNALIAYINELGAPELNIPARPHIVPGVQAALPKVEAVLKSGAKKALDGDDQAPDVVLNKVGLIAQASIQAKITDGGFVPLAPATLANRLRNGRTGDKPLIDTGAYRRSISYVLRPSRGS